MTYAVKTDMFEGPLDLLLHLITSRELDVTELSLSDLVAEYLAHLEAMNHLDMEVTSEFLLIAATLIQLKARRLLPTDTDPELDEELALGEERDRLLARLLACLTFKDVAAVIAHRWQAAARHVPRTVGLEPGMHPRPQPAPLPIDVAGLGTLAADILQRGGAEPDTDHLDLDLPSVEEAIADLRLRVQRVAVAEFDDLVTHCTRRVEIAAYFLALLELVHWGTLSISQQETWGPINVARVDEAIAGDAK